MIVRVVVVVFIVASAARDEGGGGGDGGCWTNGEGGQGRAGSPFSLVVVAGSQPCRISIQPSSIAS